MADPYPALGSNYRPPIETYTTNRGLTLTKDELTVFIKVKTEILKEFSKEIPKNVKNDERIKVDIIKIITDHSKLIDLSADFRLNSANEYLKWYKIKHKSKNNIKKSIYALPELSKNKLKNYKIL